MTTHRISRPCVEELEGRTLPSTSLIDINPGSGSSNPGVLNVNLSALPVDVNGVAFLVANDGVHGSELWKSDGTPAGTVLVKDINPGASGSYPAVSGAFDTSGLVAINGTLFFCANDGTHGVELWKSDGTAAGTVLVKDINTGAGDTPITGLTNVNGTLFFSAGLAPDGIELWKSDGTAAGTVLVKDINPGSSGSNPRSLANIGTTLFFAAEDGTDGTELWKSDGTTAGTVLVKDINLGGANSYPYGIINLNGELFFRANDGANGFALWKSDGTPVGTVLVKDINTGVDAPNSPVYLTNVSGTLFFGATDGTNGFALWKSDGTTAGTVLVKDINTGANGKYGGLYGLPTSLTNVNGTLFFSARDDGTTGEELWKSDGTTAGTVIVKNILANGTGSYPDSLTNVNGTLFFSANDGTHGNELWQSNGTAAGTIIVQDINVGGTSSNPSHLGNVNGMLFFDADDGTHGNELWTATASGGTTGPHITTAAFSGTAVSSFNRVQLTFSKPIDASSFTTADVTLTGPSGGITPTAVTPVAGSTTQFDVTFPVQSVDGVYTIVTGVNILDLAGNPMDQNQNGTNGETPGDQFTGTGTIDPPIFAVGNVGGAVRIVNSKTGAIISTIHPLDNAGVPYTGLVEVAVGDFNGDTVPDVAVAAADPSGQNGLSASKAGKVFVYDGSALATGTVPTTPFRTFTPFATSDGPAGSSGAFINGLNIAAGDVNGDGRVDLIAGSRGGNGTVGLNEYGRLVVIDATSAAGSNTVIGGIQKPFGSGYQKGVVVAAGNADGTGGDEIAVTRGGPVASLNPVVQQIKVKVLQLQGTALTELHLSVDGSTAFAPFASLSGAANAIKRDGRVAFVDTDGNGKDELVFTALDPLTSTTNEQVRVGVYSINPTASTGAATIVSTGTDAGTYLTGIAVVDHAITHVAATGTQQSLALLTESASSGIVYLAPLTGVVQTGGFSLSILHGGITIDGI